MIPLQPQRTLRFNSYKDKQDEQDSEDRGQATDNKHFFPEVCNLKPEVFSFTAECAEDAEKIGFESMVPLRPQRTLRFNSYKDRQDVQDLEKIIL